MRRLEFVIPEEYNEKRVLSFLKGEIGLSSRLIRTLKTVPDGILLDGEHIRTIDPLKAGGVLTVNIPDDKTASLPGETDPQIIYEDSDLLIVNKPAMLPIHESHNHQGDTLANCVSGYFHRKGIKCTFRAVGRLDKGTSGLVVCALNSYCASRLGGNIEKTYLAIVTGEFYGNGTIDKPIYRPDPMKTLRTADPRGDKAVTHWTALNSASGYTLMEIHLETGRTHQIRVHFASIGAPLLGDRMYGKEDERINHQALHCYKLILTHPVTGKTIKCAAPMPKEMETAAQRLGLCR